MESLNLSAISRDCSMPSWPPCGRTSLKCTLQIVIRGWLPNWFAASFVMTMPFPLAHPAAVLPLRRYCPRYFNFPALVIGSLCPDVGYFFDCGNFSHRFLAGSVGFCLPVGLLCVLVFYGVRWPVVGILPAGYRRSLLPFCQRPAGNPFLIVLSLLIGVWTHLLLDSITHPDDWLVKYLPVVTGLPLDCERFAIPRAIYYTFYYTLGCFFVFLSPSLLKLSLSSNDL
jgi:hypothetical protein